MKMESSSYFEALGNTKRNFNEGFLEKTGNCNGKFGGKAIIKNVRPTQMRKIKASAKKPTKLMKLMSAREAKCLKRRKWTRRLMKKQETADNEENLPKNSVKKEYMECKVVLHNVINQKDLINLSPVVRLKRIATRQRKTKTVKQEPHIFPKCKDIFEIQPFNTPTTEEMWNYWLEENGYIHRNIFDEYLQGCDVNEFRCDHDFNYGCYTKDDFEYQEFDQYNDYDTNKKIVSIKVFKNEVETVVSYGKENMEVEFISTTKLIEILAEWEDLRVITQQWHPNAKLADRAKELFDDNVMYYFYNILEKRLKSQE